MNGRLALAGIFAALLLSGNCFCQPDPPVVWGDWKNWGDMGDGTYRNPVLPGDYSDVDCIRVGNDYYAVSSTFQYSPGFIILSSKDLVNWTILGHVVDDISVISPAMSWKQMDRYGKGIWAGAIRYHNKRFWVYFGDPDEGYFMSTAAKPEGPWTPLKRVLAEKGWDDCCPFWDDDGQGYLVGTNFSDGYKIHLFKLSADGGSLIGGFDRVIHQSEGSEANKLYKINGYYYHLYSEVRDGGRALMMERSANIGGPYEGARQLSEVQRPYNEPNQGGLVQTVAGEWFFLTHHGTGDWSGRILSLLPVSWKDGWPVIGIPNAAGVGEMVWHSRKPVMHGLKRSPASSDDFKGKRLQRQWEWNYQPRKDKWSLTDRPGWLRLHAFKPLQNDLLTAGNTITQRVYRTTDNTVTVKFDLQGMVDGQHTGLSHFSTPDYSILGVEQVGKVRKIVCAAGRHSVQGSDIGSRFIWLRSTWGLDGLSRYSYSQDGIVFIPIGEPYQLQWSSYRGDRVAIYNYNDKNEEGFADVDYFEYSYAK